MAVRFAKGLALAFAIGLLRTYLVDSAEFGQRLRQTAYQYTQHRLAKRAGPERGLPLLIVDISDLPQTPATSRPALIRLMRAVLTLPEKPRAIGIDVDFSPDDSGWVTDEDPVFFDFCLSQSTPVFLGVHRTALCPPEAWLGVPKYSRLAASIFIQRDPREQWRWLRASGHRRLLTLGAALAQAYSGSVPQPALWLRWAVCICRQRRPVEGAEVESFLPDYGRAEQLARESVVRSRLLAHPELAAGKVLLLGDVRGGDPRDEESFLVPDRQRPSKGVILHGCAAYTLISSPLYDLTALGRATLDMVLSALLLGVLIIGGGFGHIQATGELPHATRSILTWSVVAVCLFLGMVLVHWTRIVWDDYPLVAFGLLAAEPVEAVARLTWRRLFPSPRNASDETRLGARRGQRRHAKVKRRRSR